MLIREPLRSHLEFVCVSDAPSADSSQEPPVLRIFHPGYEETYLPLLEFIAWDDGGVDYNLVYYACCILVGNAWPSDDESSAEERPAASTAGSPRVRRLGSLRNLPTMNYDEQSSNESEHDTNIVQPPVQPPSPPYLSLQSQPDAQPIPTPPDGILRGKVFFLHVPGADPQYPITPTFSHWVFPHGRVPQLWRNLPIAPSPSPIISAPVGAEYTRNRDKYCRVTNSLYGTEQAHIVPKQAADWFLANHMNVYCHPGPHAKFNDVSNTMLLRADVHRIFDNKELVFFPKSDGNNIKIVSHTLQYKLEHEELKTLYHNRQTYQLVDIRSEFLFARFAWSIFNDTTFPFLNSYPQNFALLVRVSAMAGQSPKVITKHVTSTKDIPPPPFADQKPETSRSGSKRRRKVGYFSVDEEKVVYSSDDEDWYSGSEESDDEATRGRKRERLDNSDSSMPNLSRSALSLDSNSASDASATNVPKVDMGSHGHHPKAEHVVSVRNEAGEC